MMMRGAHVGAGTPHVEVKAAHVEGRLIKLRRRVRMLKRGGVKAG